MVTSNDCLKKYGEPSASNKNMVLFDADAGFDWGGVWKRKDGMHFQLAKI